MRVVLFITVVFISSPELASSAPEKGPLHCSQHSNPRKMTTSCITAVPPKPKLEPSGSTRGNSSLCLSSRTPQPIYWPCYHHNLMRKLYRINTPLFLPSIISTYPPSTRPSQPEAIILLLPPKSRSFTLGVTAASVPLCIQILHTLIDSSSSATFLVSYENLI